jgi:hypothetical protein
MDYVLPFITARAVRLKQVLGLGSDDTGTLEP